MNTFAARIADFLKDYEPFNHIPYPQLLEIGLNTRVLNLEKNQVLFQLNDKLHDSFYVVASGVVNLSVISDAEETLLNKCNAGDVFGLRPFFAKNNYMMTAKAREETILYAISITAFKPFVAQNADVLDFLLQSFALNTQNHSGNENKGGLLSDTMNFHDKKSEIHFFQSLSYSKSPLTIKKTATVKQAAQMMTDNLTDSIIISEGNKPIGIITDTDLRIKIATGYYPVTELVTKIMATPVVTVSQDISLPEAQLMLLKSNISHLCVTLDGTDKTEIKGIIAEHDLIVAQANNPGVMIRQVKRSQSANDLKLVRDKLTDLISTSINKNIPLPHISNISGEINEAIIKRAIELAILEMGSPPARFAWLSIGSQGRKEQLLYTDQDSMLVFEDVAVDKYRDVKDYFLRLARKVTSTLEIVGYPLCPFGDMASNMSWCKSLTDWTKQYHTWMNTIEEDSSEMFAIFFDFELVFGESQLYEILIENVFKNSKNNDLLFDYLGNDALRKPPPLSFFKKFILEESEVNHDKFDIKNRGIMTLVDCARLLVLSQNIKGINNTYLRLKQLAIVDSKYAETYLNCAESFLILSRLRTMEGLKNDNDGQFIDIEELSKSDKHNLKHSFAPIKDLEEVIKGKFQLTQFS
ncbi:MAG: DUF294 nucleotidyltransferase-like domain-containing protein [Bacteroidota bacterium]